MGDTGRGWWWLGHRWYSGDRRAGRWGSTEGELMELTNGRFGDVKVTGRVFIYPPSQIFVDSETGYLDFPLTE